MKYLDKNFIHGWCIISTLLLQVFAHFNVHVRHTHLIEKIDANILQDRNARIILSDRIDLLEENIKNTMNENLLQIREEIEYNMHVIGIISEMIEDEHDI